MSHSFLRETYEDEAQCDSNRSPSPLLKHYPYAHVCCSTVCCVVFGLLASTPARAYWSSHTRGCCYMAQPWQEDTLDDMRPGITLGRYLPGPAQGPLLRRVGM